MIHSGEDLGTKQSHEPKVGAGDRAERNYLANIIKVQEIHRTGVLKIQNGNKEIPDD